MYFSAVNIKKLFFYSLVLSLIFFCSTFSQYKELKFKHLTARDGLSQNFIGTIIQDKAGFMWFSTRDGLNRYDGYGFKVYRYEPFDSNTISGHLITSSYVDSKGRIWIGTNTLNLFIPEKNAFKRIDLRSEYGRIKEIRSFDAITAITEDKNGIIWAGTDNGLLYYNPLNDSYKFFYQVQDSTSKSQDNFICSLGYLDSRLFIGTRNGLKIINPDTVKVNSSEFTGIIHFSSKQIIAEKKYILCQFFTSTNILYCGTLEGLIRIDISKKTSQNLPYRDHKFYPEWLGRIVSICGDYQGNIWLACSGGLVIYDTLKNNFHYYSHDPFDNHSLSLDNVTFLYSDRQGKIWIGTAGKGINIYDQNRKAFSLYNGLPGQEPFMSTFSVYAILADSRDVVWISNRQQVYRYDRTAGEYYRVKFSERFVGEINSILEDKKKNIWISSSDGIYKMSETGKITGHYLHDPSNSSSLKDNNVKLLYIDKEENLFALNANYLSRLNENTGTFTHYKLIFDNAADFIPVIKAINEAGNGWFWFGWTGGLVKYNLNTHESIRYIHKPGDLKSLSSNDVLTICEDPLQPNKYLWLGTDGGGLDRFDSENETFKSFTVKDGLPNNVIYGILSSGKNELWLSTNNGLCRAVIDGNGIASIKNFDESDGLQGNEFNTGAYSKSPKGELFFGGLYGVNAFFPSEIKKNTFIPPVVFTELKIFNNTYTEDKNAGTVVDFLPDSSVFNIPYSENSFSVWFASLDFTVPKKNNYMYMLKPIQKNWIDIGTQRNVIFTDLPPGDYEFFVKGSNNDGVWNEKGAVMKIIVPYPFWATWWAFTIYILAGFVLLYTIRRYELKRQEWKHSLELETVEAFKYKELNKEKSRFFANISHEFRTPLTLILGPADKLNSKFRDEEIQKQTGIIKRNAGRLLDLINQLLDLSKLEAGKLELKASKSNIVSFLKGILMSFESVAEVKDITLTVVTEYEEVELYFDKEKMTKIITNLLSNAFKFTREGGQISVSIGSIGTESVNIGIRDTGIGIPGEELPRLFDRFYQVDSSQKREHGGTGIGLALTKELVELHYGTISVSSILGEGTEFMINLPAGRDHLRDYEIVDSDESAAPGAYIDEKEFISYNYDANAEIKFSSDDKEIILVVEDNSDVREFIKDSLGEDFNIVEASNGEQGIRRAGQIIPDLIISDIMMPKVDGNEMSRVLKNDELTSHIPVILLTAKSDQQSRLEGLETGADDYITKPFDAEELRVRIKNLIRMRQKLQQLYGKNLNMNLKTEKDQKKLNDREEQFMTKVMEVIEKHLSEEAFSIEQFGREIGMSRVQLHRKLKALTGGSASIYIKKVRLLKARELIKEGNGNIAEIAYSVGFSSPQYFTRCFKEEYGYPPSTLLS